MVSLGAITLVSLLWHCAPQAQIATFTGLKSGYRLGCMPHPTIVKNDWLYFVRRVISAAGKLQRLDASTYVHR